MNKNQKLIIAITLVLPLVIAACAPTVASVPPTSVPPTSVPTQLTPPINNPTQPVSNVPTAASPKPGSEDLKREDDQGNVTVVVTPVNIRQPGETLDFDVQMNTHSVDLSMDLTKLATLTTDTGKTVAAVKWDAPMGGHHVSGTLSFPATANGSPILNGAKTLTLTIQKVDAAERIFAWQLNPS